MKSILSLDYELFFGAVTGTPDICLIEASEKLLAVLNEFDAKAVFFVDATYLLALKDQEHQSASLKADYLNTVSHIKYLESEGHQIQLHIHPHWMNSIFNGTNWEIAKDRYRLIDWSKPEAASIIKRSVDELNSHLQNKMFVFRAGGWCIQPFSHISDALYDSGINVDSTVFKRGRSRSLSHYFDFTSAPDMNSWRFDDDPCIVNNQGRFLEIPIASMQVSPMFFWKFAFVKLYGDHKKHGSFGDGVSIKNSKNDTFRMLSRYTNTVVSVDGYKSSLIVNQYEKALREGDDYFVVIGHPKALTPLSLENIKHWLCTIRDNNSNLTVFSRF